MGRTNLVGSEAGTTEIYEWDAAGRLKRVHERASSSGTADVKTIDYVYDMLGRRVAKLVDEDGSAGFGGGAGHARAEYAVWDDQGNDIVLEFADDDVTDTIAAHIARRNLWGPGSDELLAVETTAGQASSATQTLWTLADNNSNNRDVVTFAPNGSGGGATSVVQHYVFDSFGQLSQDSGNGDPAVMPYFFAGQEYDGETGLTYMDARYYDSFTHQFISPDFITDDVQNTYRYVGNDPISHIDPTGLERLVEETRDGTTYVYWQVQHLANGPWWSTDVPEARYLIGTRNGNELFLNREYGGGSIPMRIARSKIEDWGTAYIGLHLPRTMGTVEYLHNATDNERKSTIRVVIGRFRDNQLYLRSSEELLAEQEARAKRDREIDELQRKLYAQIAKEQADPRSARGMAQDTIRDLQVVTGVVNDTAQTYGSITRYEAAAIREKGANGYGTGIVKAPGRMVMGLVGLAYLAIHPREAIQFVNSMPMGTLQGMQDLFYADPDKQAEWAGDQVAVAGMIKVGGAVLEEGRLVARRRAPAVRWGAQIEYNSGTQTAMDHIRDGHFFNSRPGEKSSRFLERHSSPSRIKELVDTAFAKGKHTTSSGGQYSIVHTFEDVIGTDYIGRKSKTIHIFLDDSGNVLNAFPISDP